MTRVLRWLVSLVASAAALPYVAVAQPPRFARLGDFRLESGQVIRDLRIGYRTFGAPNPDRSNTVVLLMSAMGTTAQLHQTLVGPSRLVDSSMHYVVAIDALGNGVSSSPSNSDLQARMRFPEFTIGDMVNTQHKLLTTVLGVDHVRAVMGISMGGLQTFQWMVAYPGFMDRAIPINGSPRLAPYDVLHMQSEVDAMMSDPAWHGGDYATNPAGGVRAAIGALTLTTPEEYNRRMTREKLFAEREKARSPAGGDTNNRIRQIQAIIAFDASRPFGGSMQRAATAVKARALVVVARRDHVINPEPGLEFARLLGARTLVLEGDCGHIAPSCEAERVNAAVAEFLAR